MKMVIEIDLDVEKNRPLANICEGIDNMLRQLVKQYNPRVDVTTALQRLPDEHTLVFMERCASMEEDNIIDLRIELSREDFDKQRRSEEQASRLNVELIQEKSALKLI